MEGAISARGRSRSGKYSALLFLALSLGCAGCSINHGIRPIEPGVGHYAPVVVDSLSPTFRWEPLRQPETKYDLAVFAAAGRGKPMTRVYYREGLTETGHKMEETLSPGSHYFWSVRFRRGATTGPWANYSHTVVLPSPVLIAWWHSSNNFFPFKTPGDAPTQNSEPPPQSTDGKDDTSKQELSTD